MKIFLNKPNKIDFFILFLFTIFMTFTPYYLFGRINIFELGIYLPGIQAILDGQIPYRDFFHLRGPFELYLPAIAFAIFGSNVAVLNTFFYFGTVLTIILCILLALRILRLRFTLYMLAIVLVARTFPRVVFTFWGGMRFAIGILSLYFCVLFFQSKRIRWLFFAGISAGVALFTSADVGFCSFCACFGTLIILFLSTSVKKEKITVAIYALYFILAVMAVVMPYLLYLYINNAFLPYVDSVISVVTGLNEVFRVHFLSDTPVTFSGAVTAMINPASHNFKYMTPAYLYIIFAVFLYFRYRYADNEKRVFYISVAPVFFYGFAMYILSFRNLEGAQFEMALQPEKILLFFLMEEIYFLLKEKNVVVCLHKKIKKRISLAYVLVCVVMISSICYSIVRYNHRFFMFKYLKYKILGKDTSLLNPMIRENAVKLRMPRVNGLVVPLWQAEDIRRLTNFVHKNTTTEEPVLMLGELALYNFIVDRPFVGRFPMVIFTWFSDRWHREFISDIKRHPPKIVVEEAHPGVWFKEAYLKVKSNKEKYEELASFIKQHYILVKTTPSLLIYSLKD